MIYALEVCTGMGMAGIPQNPQDSRGCGYECCGNTAGMDLTIAGSHWDGFYYGGNPAGIVGDLTGCEIFFI